MKRIHGSYIKVLKVIPIPNMYEKLSSFLNIFYNISNRLLLDEEASLYGIEEYFPINTNEAIYVKIETLLNGGIDFKLFHEKNIKRVNGFWCYNYHNNAKNFEGASFLYTYYDNWFSYCYFDWNRLYQYLNMLLLKLT